MSESDPDFTLGGFTAKPMKIEFVQVDPEFLDILFGGQVTASTEPTFSLEMWSPIKRTWWQRLLRRPVRHRRIYLPSVTIEKEQS